MLSNIAFKAIRQSNGTTMKVATFTISFAVLAIIMAISVASGFRTRLTGYLLQTEGDLWLECRDESRIYKKPQAVDENLIGRLYDCGATNIECRLSTTVVVLDDSGPVPIELRSSEGMSSHGGMAISSLLASKLKVSEGDKLDVMYSTKVPFAFKVNIDSIYDCSIAEIASSIAYSSFSLISEYRGLKDNNLVDGYVVWGIDAEKASNAIEEQNIWIYEPQDRFAGIFDWLDVIDGNVWIVVVILMFVGMVNMLSACLVIILDNIHSLAVLKSLGMPSSEIRAGIFKRVLYITSIGAFIGFVIALFISYIQDNLKIVSLPSDEYMLDTIPMEISVATDAVITVLLVFAVSLVAYLAGIVIDKIEEEKVLRYE